MHKTMKLVMAALAAAVVLSFAAGPASARSRVEVSTTSITATSERLTFGGTIDIICNVTLAGTLSRLITKTRGSAAGTFNADTINECRSNFGINASADALTAGRMRIAYGSIRGTLPTITGGTLEVTGGFLIRVTSITGTVACLFEGTIGAESTENPARTQTILANTARLVTDLRAGGTCPSEGELAGRFSLTPSVTIRLLER